MNAQSMISVEGLRKSYGSMSVLGGVDIAVERGEVFALLGPNGAGKTTTVNILTTLIHADGGRAHVAGYDVARQPAQVREAIGLTGQYAAVDEFQTGAENLAMMARLAHLPRRAARARTAELIEQFGLADARDRKVSGYSGGMRRRLDLAASLIARPRVVFLDEPTTGLDPRSRAGLWQIVRDLAAAGTTILLTTQYLEEADQLADRIAVIDGGIVIAQGTPDELKSRVSGEHIRIALDDDASFAGARALPLGPDARFDSELLGVTVPTTDSVGTIRDLLAMTSRHGLTVNNISIIKPTLDDVFFSLTGRSTEDAAGNEDAGAREKQEVNA